MIVDPPTWKDQNLRNHFDLFYQLGREGKLTMENIQSAWTCENCGAPVAGPYEKCPRCEVPPSREYPNLGAHGEEIAREFTSGAKRSSEEGKLNFIGALSPFALEAYLDYLRRCNNQVHRTEENWKKGIPLDSFMKSQARHFLTQWKLHAEGGTAVTHPMMIDAICGVIFNAFGYLHELTKPETRDMLKAFLENSQ